MSYESPESSDSNSQYIVGLSGQNGVTIVQATVTFNTLKYDEVALGTPAVDADDLFQHLVDHLAALPEFPGSGEGIEITVVAAKSHTSNTSQICTPTEAPE